MNSSVATIIPPTATANNSVRMVHSGLPAPSKKLCSKDKKKFSRRKPIYQLLESLIVYKKCVPAEAFRLIETHLGKLKMGQMAKLIREHVEGGTMPPALFVRNYKYELRYISSVPRFLTQP